jgi:hypothetical protein
VRSSELLSAAATWSLVDAAVRTLAGLETWAYAVLLDEEGLTVRLAQRSPTPLPRPWRAAAGGSWTIHRRELAALDPAGPAVSRPSDWYLALGSHDGGLLLLDVFPTTAAVSVSGDPRACVRLVSCLMAQFRSVPGHRVLAADGVLPGAIPTALPAVLKAVESADPAPTFVVCAEPGPQDSTRLHALLAARPWFKAVVLGETKGSRWPLTVDADGLVRSRALGLTASAADLPRTVRNRPGPVTLAAPPRPRPQRSSQQSSPLSTSQATRSPSQSSGLPESPEPSAFSSQFPREARPQALLFARTGLGPAPESDPGEVRTGVRQAARPTGSGRGLGGKARQ